jgi:RTX calcium-binding nonapeptide repeat (4 copies)
MRLVRSKKGNSDHGHSQVGTETGVNTTTLNNQNASVVSALQDGGYVVAWVDDMGAASSVVKFQRYTAAGVKAGLENTVPISDGSGDQDQPTLATTDAGNFIIGVRDYDGVGDHDTMAYEFSATGAFVRDYGLDSSFLDSGAPAIEALGSTTALAFRLETGDVVVQSRSADGSTSIAPRVLFNASGIGGPVAFSHQQYGLFNGYSVAMAASTTKLEFQFVQANFASSGLTKQVSVSYQVNNIDCEFLQNQEVGRVAYTYETLVDAGTGKTRIGYGIGDIITSSFTNFELENGSEPSIVALKNGQFVITYHLSANTFVGQPNVQPLQVQLFNADGTKVGEPVTINTNGLQTNSDPSIDILGDGRLIVTWTETSGLDGSGNGIFQQIVDPRDGVVNGSTNPLLSDVLYGNESNNDVMNGYAGNDTLRGLAGSDTIYGGDGDDLLFGDRGDDTNYGGNNTDRIYGDFGDDEQYGEAGSDLIYSGRGADLMDGSAGSDTAYYSSEKIGAIINLLDQTLNAGSADGDTLLNFEGIFGSNTAADNITGSNGNETILGNGGNDVLNGSGGNDFMRGGAGADTLNGGTGADKFQYTALNELGDTIINYEAIDDFQFTRAAFGNLAGANVAAINFLSVASGNAATTVDHRFIFDQALDQLWYDADGSNAGAAVMVADLSNNINLTNLDLLLM